MINISEEINKSVYYNLEECLEFCKEVKEDNFEIENITDYHVFWNVGYPFERKQILGLKSYLCTQDLEKTRFNLWCNVDLRGNEYLKPFLHLINFRIYDISEEAKGTPIEKRQDIINAGDTYPNLNWTKGDLFRVLVLHKYGGLYADMDIVFLRSFAPVLDQEFMYKWGNESEMINGAVMRLFRNSRLSTNLINEIAMGPVCPNSTNWSTNLYQRVRSYNKNWTIFPAAFFNPEWQDTSLGDWNPMKKYDFKTYDGAFSWHWHNKWLEEIEIGSKWQLMEERFDKLLKEKNIL